MALRVPQTFLRFDTETLDAARVYVDLFPNSLLGEGGWTGVAAPRAADHLLLALTT